MSSNKEIEYPTVYDEIFYYLKNEKINNMFCMDLLELKKDVSGEIFEEIENFVYIDTDIEALITFLISSNIYTLNQILYKLKEISESIHMPGNISTQKNTHNQFLDHCGEIIYEFLNRYNRPYCIIGGKAFLAWINPSYIGTEKHYKSKDWDIVVEGRPSESKNFIIKLYKILNKIQLQDFNIHEIGCMIENTTTFSTLSSTTHNDSYIHQISYAFYDTNGTLRKKNLVDVHSIPKITKESLVNIGDLTYINLKSIIDNIIEVNEHANTKMSKRNSRLLFLQSCLHDNTKINPLIARKNITGYTDLRPLSATALS